MSEVMIDIKGVNKWYGQFQVLTDCTTAIKKGEVVVVCGPSGSGKSTLIKTVNALEPFQKGDIVVNGTSIADPKTDMSKLRSKVGMVFQHFELFPHLSITENLTVAQVKVLGRSMDEAKKKGLAYLDRVGLSAHAHKYPAELSGGQQQRVAIGNRLRHMGRADRSVRTRFRIDQERPLQGGRHALAQQPGRKVRRSTGRERRDDGHRARRRELRKSGHDRAEQRGRKQMAKHEPGIRFEFHRGLLVVLV